MNLIIDFDAISDVGKKDWLLRNLKVMGIGFYTSEEPQTLEEYNSELEEGSAEIEKGNFITNEQLKKDVMSW
jgi:hypothetical protein